MADMSKKSKTELASAYARAKNQLANIREENKGAIQSGIRTAVGAGSAFGLGYFEHRYPDKATVVGMDLSLLVGVGATAAGALGLVKDKDTASMLEAAGLGGICAFAAKKGAEMGAEAANNA